MADTDTQPSGYDPLTDRQRKILDLLLTAEIAGVAELRQQARLASAKPWDCGCASVDLWVDRDHAPRSSGPTGPVTQADSKSPDDSVIGLMLWVTDGWLSGIEMVEVFDNHDDAPRVFPPPDSFDPARGR
jgi:hypothetical protein